MFYNYTSVLHDNQWHLISFVAGDGYTLLVRDNLRGHLHSACCLLRKRYKTQKTVRELYSIGNH